MVFVRIFFKESFVNGWEFYDEGVCGGYDNCKKYVWVIVVGY